MRRWVGDLNAREAEKETKVRALYFDAFERDYLDKPVVSLVHAVVERVPDKEGKLKNVAKRVLPRLAKSAVNIVTARAMREFEEIGNAVASEVGDLYGLHSPAGQSGFDASMFDRMDAFDVSGNS